MDEESTDLAHAVALGFASDDDHTRLDALTAADPEFRSEFDSLVRATRESLAAISSLTATEPPPALRARLLEQISPPVVALDERRSPARRWRQGIVAAAAAIALLAGGVALGYNLRPAPEPSVTAAILGAPDTKAASTPLSVGGSATIVYSRSENAAVVLFDDVAAPPADDVYQMWLIADGSPRSAGLVELETAAVTREVIEDLDDASIVAFTVEPGGGSPAPTSQPFAAIEI